MNLTIGTWKYPHVKKRTAYFRGYIQKIDKDGDRVFKRRKACKEVRETKAEALSDAKLLKEQTIKHLNKRK